MHLEKKKKIAVWKSEKKICIFKSQGDAFYKMHDFKGWTVIFPKAIKFLLNAFWNCYFFK